MTGKDKVMKISRLDLFKALASLGAAALVPKMEAAETLLGMPIVESDELPCPDIVFEDWKQWLEFGPDGALYVRGEFITTEDFLYDDEVFARVVKEEFSRALAEEVNRDFERELFGGGVGKPIGILGSRA